MKWHPQEPGLGHKLKETIIGPEVNLKDPSLMRRLSLIAFFAWIGLGADGLSSSCYGPAEAFAALGEHHFLAVLVGLGTVFTIFIISISYTQIIELFPHGGGGYMVATELLNPHLGMVSGCALIIDYALTIALSIASGADAAFSILPAHWAEFKVPAAAIAIIFLTVLNLRGVKESIHALTPIFMIFVITHVFVICYALFTHAMDAPAVVEKIGADIQSSHTELGTLGLIILLLRAYSLGAGTYTGLEAVSNGLPMLHEPRVQTGKRTMMYMACSLSITVMGLMLAYVLYAVNFVPGKTLNASLFEAVTFSWPSPWGHIFVLVTLASEAMLLLVAAQTGFLDGPRVMANMAHDHWLPNRFTILSDRLVMQNGTLCFGFAALFLIVIFKGQVSQLVILYSINVFITFALSQAGMVKHWWETKKSGSLLWKRKLAVNGLGLSLTLFILLSVVLVKFEEGGWVTLLVTSGLVGLALLIKKHYYKVRQDINAMNRIIDHVEQSGLPVKVDRQQICPHQLTDPATAVLLVNGYNGLGLSSIIAILNAYGDLFKTFVFVEIGVVNSSIFKRSSLVENLEKELTASLSNYSALMEKHGFAAKGLWAIGTDVVHEVVEMVPEILSKYSNCVFFGGQLIFEKENIVTHLLHNYQTMSLQRKLFHLGQQFVSLPIYLEKEKR